MVREVGHAFFETLTRHAQTPSESSEDVREESTPMHRARSPVQLSCLVRLRRSRPALLLFAPSITRHTAWLVYRQNRDAEQDDETADRMG
jgi:hypothetical protein